MASDLARFLTRAALDADFRRLATHDPEAAFQGYDLSHEDMELLRRRDARVLELLGRAVSEALPQPPAEAPPAAGPPAEAQLLPEISLLVRLQPWAVALPDGRLQISWSASMEPYVPANGVNPSATGGGSADGVNPSATVGGGATDAREAAEAVLTASPDDRYLRLLDLVQILDDPARS